ncbi:hypothetical protein [Leptospira meyeri]|uniref:hypothetical protein n=1 Tax=Leptospira meyeri TaxID=29508 RepID=UPI0002BF7419|nr:hypothetical protein [Leptospira meyeri]EMJ88682.1 hypothetical protein LEP1GSC196_1508 [Leptospira meyeri serovar Semaranga str. Veldrot Semarang 173]
MPIWIRKTHNEKTENYVNLIENDWNLTAQFEALEEWLKTVDEKLDQKVEWIADLGFAPRTNALGGGPVISLDLMKLCIKNNLEIFISEYPDSTKEDMQ